MSSNGGGYFSDAGLFFVFVFQSGCMYVFGGVTIPSNETRINDVYKIWLTVPTLQEMAWSAISRRLHHCRSSSLQLQLMEAGVPWEFTQRVLSWSVCVVCEELVRWRPVCHGNSRSACCLDLCVWCVKRWSWERERDHVCFQYCVSSVGACCGVHTCLWGIVGLCVCVWKRGSVCFQWVCIFSIVCLQWAHTMMCIHACEGEWDSVYVCVFIMACCMSMTVRVFMCSSM